MPWLHNGGLHGCIESFVLHRWTPKQAKLQLLSLAAGINSSKGNVIEDIADLLIKLPLDSIIDKNKIGEVDMQTRYYEPLLSAILSDTTKKVILR